MSALSAPPPSPDRVVLREVGLRDGLQSIARVVPTEVKRAWLHAAYAAGLREIEVGSFVPPRLMPQLADTAEMVAAAKALPGLVVSVLVPVSFFRDSCRMANLKKLTKTKTMNWLN